MKHLSASQMREADRRCIEEIGIPGVVLMNNAGAAVFREVENGPVGVVCGKGNNGGDGYVVARLALLSGMPAHVYILAAAEEIRGDAAVFLHAYQRLGGAYTHLRTEEEAHAALAQLAQCATLVDAILGTGVSGTVRGLHHTVIKHWPKVRTVAVDLPSGMDADTGQACGVCVRADLTVTFQHPKMGMQNACAAPFLGRLIVADIGIPEICCDDEAWTKRQE